MEEDPNAPWYEDSCDFKQLVMVGSLLQIALIFAIGILSR